MSSLAPEAVQPAPTSPVSTPEQIKPTPVATPAIEAPVQPESVKPPEVSLYNEAEKMVRSSLMRKAAEFKKNGWQGDGPGKNALSFLEGITNASEGAYKNPELVTDPDPSKDMYVISDLHGDVDSLVTTEDPFVGDEYRKVKLTTLTARYKNMLTFSTDATEPPQVHLTVEQFQKLFTYAQRADFLETFHGAERTVAEQYIEHMGDPSTMSLDRDTLAEAVKNEGHITTEALKGALPARNESKGTTPEEQKAIDAWNQKRDKLMERLQNHTIATPEDMAGVLSLTTPGEIQETIAGYNKKINTGLEQMNQLRQQLAMAHDTGNQAQITELSQQIDALQKEISKNREEIKKQEQAAEFFEKPENLIDFFKMIDSGQITPEMGKQINELIAQGNMNEALMKMAEAQLATLSPEQIDEIKNKLGLTDKDKLILTTAGGALFLILMMLMEAVKH